MPVTFPIYEARANSILSRASGFIAEAGFSYTLTPARNCTYGCTYCYVPTIRIYGGLKAEDWRRWGQFTTFKINAAELLRRELRAQQIIYCSPLVDPYQPAEVERLAMPAILEAVIASPPSVFVIQTRGPSIVRDIPLLRELSQRTRLRVSFSITTDREDVRRLYEPLCAPMPERFAAVDALRAAGIETWVTLAPILPCNPETLVEQAIARGDHDIVADPLHTRATKAQGATTREGAYRISEKHGFTDWHEPAFQRAIVERMQTVARNSGRRLSTGPVAFRWLAS